ncbi:MAG TPA: hypothetical protein VET51_10080 [Burkholderiales bacterium]|nr:hypothetical protein [Burkholderiales bacterium]
MAQSLQTRALKKAARILGGEGGLSAFLQVPSQDLSRWIRGEDAVPECIVLRLVDFLAEAEAAREKSLDNGSQPQLTLGV